jgi:hypothetical protein
MITLAAHDAGLTVIAGVSGRLPCGAPFCGAHGRLAEFRPSSLRAYSMFSIACLAVFIASAWVGTTDRTLVPRRPRSTHERCAVFTASRKDSYWLAGKSGTSMPLTLIASSTRPPW